MTIRVPSTTVSFTMVPVKADGVTLWALETEVPWELYDIFVYSLDQPNGSDGDTSETTADASSSVDAVSRPSKPYVPPDRGYGHHGYAAMGMTHHAAEQFCVWLNAATGGEFRLPKAAEWEMLASDDTDAPIDDRAWHSGIAGNTTHPVRTKQANSHGLYDTLGNVAEWVVTDSRRPVAMGGSYVDPADECTPTSRQVQDSSWNMSDPQFPKSQWWLADCSWVGFRIVAHDIADALANTPAPVALDESTSADKGKGTEERDDR
ncbi:MAG: SUMF1/EgtB/PvdO family nonheme iron enzyme [Planctomycetota bacterium]